MHQEMKQEELLYTCLHPPVSSPGWFCLGVCSRPVWTPVDTAGCLYPWHLTEMSCVSGIGLYWSACAVTLLTGSWKKMNLRCRTSSRQVSAVSWMANNIILSPPPVSLRCSFTFPFWWHDGYESVTLTGRVVCNRIGSKWRRQRDMGRGRWRYMEVEEKWS